MTTNVRTDPKTLGLALSRLMRPENTRFSVLFFLLPQVMLGGRVFQMVAGSALILFLYGISTAYNDLRDLDIDTTNKRRLPLAQKIITARQAKGLILFLAVSASLLNIFLPQPASMAITISYLVLAAAYSAPVIHLSHKGLLGTLTLGICYLGLPFWLGMAYTGQQLSIGIWLAIVSSVLFAAPILLYKDFKDIHGDSLHGKLTPVVRYGKPKTKILAMMFYLSALAFAAKGGMMTQPAGYILAGLSVMVLSIAAVHQKHRQKWLLVYILLVLTMFALYFWSIKNG